MGGLGLDRAGGVHDGARVCDSTVSVLLPHAGECDSVMGRHFVRGFSVLTLPMRLAPQGPVGFLLYISIVRPFVLTGQGKGKTE